MLNLTMPATDGIQLLSGLAEGTCNAYLIQACGADMHVLETWKPSDVKIRPTATPPITRFGDTPISTMRVSSVVRFLLRDLMVFRSLS
jgi:hypothetical protein